MKPLDGAPRAREAEPGRGVSGAERGAGSRAHPAELRRTATVARHHDMPSVAAALDAAADRIEGLEALASPSDALLAAYDAHHAESLRLFDAINSADLSFRLKPWCASLLAVCQTRRESAAREALREVGR